MRHGQSVEKRSTILLVEDNSDDVLLFQTALREVGQDYDVHVVGSGEAAIDYLQHACQGGEVPGYPVPKFLMTDHKMPGLQGRDLLLWMSEHSVYSVVPTVVLSGSDWPKDVKLAFELGVQGYFVKPVGFVELKDLLKMIFRYWTASSVPPVRRFEFTGQGEEPVLKK